MENKKLITVEASMENLDKITSFVEAFLDDYACPMKIAMKILLCVEELYANVVNYAYGSRVHSLITRDGSVCVLDNTI